MINNNIPMSELLNFNDLDFKPHSNADGVHARLDLGNGLEISVVANNDGGDGLYGNVSDDLYEVAIFDDDGMVPLSVGDDVLAWQSPAQVSKHMRDAQLNGDAWVDLLKKLRKDFRDDLDLD